MFKYALFVLTAFLMLGAGAVHAAPATEASAKEFAKTYAQVAFLSYKDAADTAAQLEEKIEALVDGPSEANLKAAKDAWLASRIPYGQTEAFRFAEGPIDGTNAQGVEGPEGRINAWPLNEAYIDYVKDNPKAGIIQNMEIAISDDTLTAKNQAEDEADVTTGYHAIEFLLWGQDFSADGPGSRPVADYTAGNPVNERRQKYLEETAELLVKDLSHVAEAWAPDADNYRKTFVSLDSNEVLTRALTSLATLSGFELASERIATALDSGDQEDEHSCFSDNTHVDFIMNARSIDNIYYGRYGSYQGTGLDAIARVVDMDLARKIDVQLADTRTIVEGIKPPIDQILASPAGSEGRKQLESLVKSLQAQAELFKQLGTKMGLTIAIKS